MLEDIQNSLVRNKILGSFTTFASGLTENEQKAKFNLHPNPTSDNFNIETDSTIKLVEIYSLQGHKVLISTSKNVNISSLSAEIYLVRIEDSNNAVSTQKLVIR